MGVAPGLEKQVNSPLTRGEMGDVHVADTEGCQVWNETTSAKWAGTAPMARAGNTGRAGGGGSKST